MRTARKVLIPMIAAAFILAGALALTWADGDVALSGITVEDKHPNGCIDCHSNASGTDYRLNVSLKEMEGHPDISRFVNELPQGCAMCHKANVPAGSLSNVVHKSHYANPSENHFVTGYAGECLACHTLNTANGAMGNKSAPKNW